MGLLNLIVALGLCCVWSVSVGRWQPVCSVAAQSAPPLPDCSKALVFVIDCLDYVTGQSAVPTSTCCGGVLNLHLNRPVCLCELALDTNNTRAIPGYKLELAEQLPTTCDIQGASISNCPALLGQVPAASPTSGAPPGPETGAADKLLLSKMSWDGIMICLAVAVVSLSNFITGTELYYANLNIDT